VYASLKNQPKTNGKKGRRKEYITCIAYAAPVASLKTLHEKIQWKKLTEEKRVQQFDLQVWSSGPTGLQDQIMIL